MAESPGARLFKACAEGRLSDAIQLLKGGADPNYKDPADSETPLMKAAENGHVEVMELLLNEGAPWNELDSGGHCAGEYASATKQLAAMELLLEWGVMAETVLGAEERAKREGVPADDEYLKQKLSYTDDGEKLMDADGEAVMMSWELPLMERHADVICAGGGDVLNIGFGLGLIDEEIQKRKPRSHTIIEAHPDVHAHMLKLGWGERPGVRVVFGKWQDVLVDSSNKFDGIFFDTYSEHYSDMQDLHMALPRVLRPGGVYSFFNGLCPDNIFFGAVYGRLVSRELGGLGMSTQFEMVEMDASKAAIWSGVKNRYWHHNKYFLPTCTMRGEGAGGAEEDGKG